MHSDRTSTRMRCGRTQPCAREPMGTEPSIKQANLLFGPGARSNMLQSAGSRQAMFVKARLVVDGSGEYTWSHARHEVSARNREVCNHCASSHKHASAPPMTNAPLSMRAGGPTPRKSLRVDRPTHTPCFRAPWIFLPTATALRRAQYRYAHTMLALAIPESLCDGRRYAAFDTCEAREGLLCGPRGVCLRSACTSRAVCVDKTAAPMSRRIRENCEFGGSLSGATTPSAMLTHLVETSNLPSTIRPSSKTPPHRRPPLLGYGMFPGARDDRDTLDEGGCGQRGAPRPARAPG
ncbi:hypothetical protein GGX14DRAFT_660960 [Mycena pura]|uniref:Uncharacterized protein n=1 Tax=Mycena pura TaxID=153505 RepID=A0AAD6Y3V4_9AGAR|nr:hypothetical protein GGX14DRAFT_660960 [Mycena pura]